MVPKDSKEIIRSSTFTRWTYIKTCVKAGVQVLARTEARKGAKGEKKNKTQLYFFFHGIPSVSLSDLDMLLTNFLLSLKEDLLKPPQ